MVRTPADDVPSHRRDALIALGLVSKAPGGDELALDDREVDPYLCSAMRHGQGTGVPNDYLGQVRRPFARIRAHLRVREISRSSLGHLTAQQIRPGT